MFKKVENINICENYPLKNLSTMRVGGNAKFFIICKTIGALKKVILICHSHKLKYKIIGGGSNMLFDDQGYNGVIIKLNFNIATLNKNYCKLSADIPMANAINFCYQNSLSGLENFVGIPCQIGGAIKNNLGAFNKEISDNLIKIKYLKIIYKNNKLKFKIKNKLIKNTRNKYFSYRKCNLFNNNEIILFGYFKFKKLNKKIIKNNIINYLNKKSSTQPLDKYSLGSIFKRKNDFIPALEFDKLNLKGMAVGDAEVSKKHAGFIVNNADASCQDILKLIFQLKNIIKGKHNVDLEEEIEYLPY